MVVFASRHRRKDGSVFPVEVRAQSFWEGGCRLTVALARDMTDWKRAEEALRQSEAQSRRLLAFHEAVTTHMAEGLYALDTQGQVTYLNPAAESLFGWTRAELLGRRLHDVTHYKHPDGTPFPIEECAGFQALHKGRPLKDHDDVFIRKDGTFFPVVYSASRLMAGGEVAGLVVVFHDITERKRAEDALRESEERFRGTFENAAVGIAHADSEGRWLRVNQKYCEIVGYSREELLQRPSRT